MDISYDKEKFTNYYNLICQNCGKSYTGKTIIQKICPECREEKSKRFCKGCGKPNENKGKLFCFDCEAKRMKPKYQIKCDTCGTEFETRRGYMRFCSPECRNAKTQAVHEERKCAYCGNFFVTNNARQIYCSRACEKKSNSKTKPDVMRRGNTCSTDKAYYNRVQSIYSRFEYIGGWEDGYAFFLCKDCGHTFKHGTNNTRPSHEHNMQCPNCKNTLSIISHRQKNELKQQEIAKRKEYQREKQRQKSLEKVYTQKTFSTCPVCDSLFYSNRINAKYCSKRCRDAYNWKIRDIYTVKVPLEKLYERDNGICWICGGKCDMNDIRINKRGYKVHGNNYPSRDHIIHKSKGGSHTWDNIKLAHRRCNSLRGTKEWIKIN